MKILLLVQKEQRILLDNFYKTIQSYTNCDVFWLTSDEQSSLKKWFSEHASVDHYDRIILFLRFKKEIKQVKFIRTIPNLVILEHDAYQNYIPCKYQHKFADYYRKLPWARIFTSGFSVSKKLRKDGFDAVFIPKCFDAQLFKNLHIERDIELGFIGSTKSKTYSQRKEMLDMLAEKEKLLITRTNSGKEYFNALNRIRFFISADVGMGEYMIKNFEAMACGCVLFAWNQGEDENQALDFKDMDNIVLYSSAEELRSKIHLLRNDEALADKIAGNGQKHAEAYFTFEHIGKKIAQEIKLPLRKKVVKRYFGIRRYSWSFPEHTT